MKAVQITKMKFLKFTTHVFSALLILLSISAIFATISITGCKPKHSDLPSNTEDPAVSNQTVSQTPSIPLRLLYSSNLNGELEPCGCTVETDYGGLLRRATLIDQLKLQYPQMLLISAGGLLDNTASTHKIKNEAILEGFQLLEYDAIGVQWQDLAFGYKTIKNNQLPLISSNYPGDDFAKLRKITRPGIKLTVFSILDPETFQLMGKEHAFKAKTQQLSQQISIAKQQGSLILVTTRSRHEWISQHLPLADIDILIAPLANEFFEQPNVDGSTLILKPGHRGMRMGLLTLWVNNNKWTKHEHEVLELTTAVANSERLSGWYQAYNDKVRIDYENTNKLKLKRKRKLETTPYVSEAICKNCHTAAHDIWSKSEHSHAVATLEAKGKAFDPECLSCHTVGFHQDGGFIDMELSPELANVQCENCHSNTRSHSQNPINHKPSLTADSPKAVCKQCHNHNHSPSFEFQTYWPKIKH